MKTSAKLTTETEKLLQTIADRQTELTKITSRMIETESKPIQQKNTTELNYNWLEPFSKNPVLMTKAI